MYKKIKDNYLIEIANKKMLIIIIITMKIMNKTMYMKCKTNIKLSLFR